MINWNAWKELFGSLQNSSFVLKAKWVCTQFLQKGSLSCAYYYFLIFLLVHFSWKEIPVEPRWRISVLSIEQDQLTEITEAVFTRMFSGLNLCLTWLVKSISQSLAPFYLHFSFAWEITFHQFITFDSQQFKNVLLNSTKIPVEPWVWLMKEERAWAKFLLPLNLLELWE